MCIAMVVTTAILSEEQSMLEKALENKYDLSCFLQEATEEAEQTSSV